MLCKVQWQPLQTWPGPLGFWQQERFCSVERSNDTSNNELVMHMEATITCKCIIGEANDEEVKMLSHLIMDAASNNITRRQLQAIIVL